MSIWLKTVYDNLKELDHIKYHLCKLANALDMTGNNILADDLSDMGCNLEKISSNIDGAVSITLNDQVKTAQQSSANMLELAIGMEKIKT